jgi:mannitol-specific phosphotransferase system IIBC component
MIWLCLDRHTYSFLGSMILYIVKKKGKKRKERKRKEKKRKEKKRKEKKRKEKKRKEKKRKEKKRLSRRHGLVCISPMFKFTEELTIHRRKEKKRKEKKRIIIITYATRLHNLG